MQKRSKKLVSVLLTLSLLAVLLAAPAAGPAVATSVNAVDRVPALRDNFTGIASRLTIKEDNNFPNDFRGGDSFRITLRTGIKWLRDGNSYVDENGSSVLPTISNRFGTENLIISIVSDSTMYVTLPNTVGGVPVTDNDAVDTMVFPLSVDLNGVTGDMYFTIDPMDSGVSSGTDNFTEVRTGGAKTTVTANNKLPQIVGGDAQGWSNVAEALKQLAEGSSPTINLNGSSLVPADVMNAVAGRDITLRLVVNDQVSFELNGENVKTEITSITDVGIELDTKNIPQTMLEEFTGVSGSRQFTLRHRGPYNFKYIMHIYVDKKLAGQYATLFRKDGDTLRKVSVSSIDVKGWVALSNDQASDYVILAAVQELNEPNDVNDINNSEVAGHAGNLNQPTTVAAWINPFSDVSESDWYFDAVRFVCERGLFAGTSSDRFEPDFPITRGMLLTALWRLAGEPTGGAASFSDVPEGEWYAAAVGWGVAQGIVKGHSATEFAPEELINREQTAAILYRYAQSSGRQVNSGAGAAFTGFPDWSAVSDWAETALLWCCDEGLIEGKVSGTEPLLVPQGITSRAEAAAIFMRLAAVGMD